MTPSPQPTTSQPSPTPFEPAAVPTETPKVEPLVDLGHGTFVDVRTGAASRLPRSITSVRGAGNYDVSPDGSMILFDNARLAAPHTKPAKRGLHRLYVANIDGSHVRRLTDDPIGASEGSWSPDGTKVVYLGGWARLCCWLSPADLMVLDVATGRTTLRAHDVARDLQNPFFSEDGNEILFTRGAGSPWGGGSMRADLWTIPVDGGRPELVLEDRGYASYSPDGATIVFPRLVSWHEGNFGATYAEIWTSDPDGRHARKLVRSGGWFHTSGQGRWSPGGRWLFYRTWGPPNFKRGRLQVLDTKTGRATVLSGGHRLRLARRHDADRGEAIGLFT